MAGNRQLIDPSKSTAKCVCLAGAADSWECTHCTFLNDSALPSCELCHTPKGGIPNGADCDVVYIDGDAASSEVRTHNNPESGGKGLLSCIVSSGFALMQLTPCPSLILVDSLFAQQHLIEFSLHWCRNWRRATDQRLVQAAGSHVRTCTFWTPVAAGTAGKAATAWCHNCLPFLGCLRSINGNRTALSSAALQSRHMKSNLQRPVHLRASAIIAVLVVITSWDASTQSIAFQAECLAVARFKHAMG